MKNIVFFGDSFACYGDNANAGRQRKTDHRSPESYLDIVARECGATPIYMGFGGVSWWYSYARLKEWIEENPIDWRKTEALVMCLTNATRVKISDPYDFDRYHRSKHEQHAHIHALRIDFEKWAYEKFVEEIKKMTVNKKVILLPCFNDEKWLSVTFRKDFATSALNLCTISYSEFKAGVEINRREDVVKLVGDDKRANHLNQHNNRALAADLIDKLNNYRPGIFMLNQSAYDRNNNFFQHEYDEAAELYNKYCTR
jgi:hypothetical protein